MQRSSSSSSSSSSKAAAKTAALSWSELATNALGNLVTLPNVNELGSMIYGSGAHVKGRELSPSAKLRRAVHVAMAIAHWTKQVSWASAVLRVQSAWRGYDSRRLHRSLARAHIQEAMQQEAREGQGSKSQQKMVALCTICLDELPIEAGVQCGDQDVAERHFVCGACLDGHVQSFVEATTSNPDLLREREGRVYCPLRGHGCAHDMPFGRTLLAKHLSEDTFEQLLSARDKRAEQRAFEEVQERLEAEERQLRQQQQQQQQQQQAQAQGQAKAQAQVQAQAQAQAGAHRATRPRPRLSVAPSWILQCFGAQPGSSSATTLRFAQQGKLGFVVSSAPSGGIQVTRVIAGGQAQLLGLQRGDIITAINGVDVNRCVRGLIDQPSNARAVGKYLDSLPRPLEVVARRPATPAAAPAAPVAAPAAAPAGPPAAAVSTELRQRMLAEQLRRSMPNARMCGRCSFGPVDHYACGDLRAHNGDTVRNRRGGRSARINNACPKCGWFSGEIRDWPKWDGRVQMDAVAERVEVATTPPSRLKTMFRGTRRRRRRAAAAAP